MANLTIKGIPDSLYRHLKRSATEHRRSINSEVIVCLERSLLPRPVDPEAFLSHIRGVHERLDLPPLTDKLLRQAKEYGRP